MSYKIGDKVLIVDRRVDGMNTSGQMDKYLCKIMTIRSSCNSEYHMEEDIDALYGHGWYWYDHMIERKVL